MATDLRSGLIEAGRLLGVEPVDIGTVVGYETGGTYDPWKRGPKTKYGTHRGLIQFGEPQAKKYGAFEGQSAYDQLTGPVVSYLRDTGVKPGMGLLDIYSAVNAGGVGRYNASDAAAGGAPGTVADKVANQMDAHRAKAAAILGGDFVPSAPKYTGMPTQTRAAAGDAMKQTMRPGAENVAEGATAAPADDYGEVLRILEQLAPPKPAAQATPQAALAAEPSALAAMAQEPQAPPPTFDPQRFYALLRR